MKPDMHTHVLERPLAAEQFQLDEQAGFKSILFQVHEDDGVMDRLEVALTIARAFGGHVHCLHVTPIEAYSVVDTFGGTFVTGQIVEALEESADALRTRIEAKLRKEDVSWNYEELTGEPLPRLIQRASLSDVVLVAREPRGHSLETPPVTMLGELLVHARTPLFVTGDSQRDFHLFGPAVVAWNGSYEAANAVRGALPLLRLASSVTVVCFSEDQEELFPSTELAEYLSRHDVAAELDIEPVPGSGIGPGLIGYAERKGASYMVLGGYSHSRAGEFLFGGVTRELLKHCPLPLVLGH